MILNHLQTQNGDAAYLRYTDMDTVKIIETKLKFKYTCRFDRFPRKWNFRSYFQR